MVAALILQLMRALWKLRMVPPAIASPQLRVRRIRPRVAAVTIRERLTCDGGISDGLGRTFDPHHAFFLVFYNRRCSWLRLIRVFCYYMVIEATISTDQVIWVGDAQRL